MRCVAFLLLNVLFVVQCVEIEEEPTYNTSLSFAIVGYRSGLRGLGKGDFYNPDYSGGEDVLDLMTVGDLTKRGKVQGFATGQVLRKRYGHLFNYTYNQYNVATYSSYQNRCMTYAELVHAGLFPPQSDFENWNSEINWQPIPVHIDRRLPDRGSGIISVYGGCPSLRSIVNTTIWMDYNKKYETLITYMCTQAGVEPDLVAGLSIANNLNYLSYYKGSEPMWANDTIMKAANEFYFGFHETVTKFPAVMRLATGWLLEDIGYELRRFIGHSIYRRAVTFSMHVDNMNVLMAALNNGTVPEQWPPLGSWMSIELHYIPEYDYIVKAFYWYTVRDGPFEIEISNCSHPCTVEKFIARNEMYKVDNWDLECGLSTGPGEGMPVVQSVSSVNVWLVVFTVIFGLLAIISTAGWITTKRRMDNKRSEYSVLD